MSTEQDRANRAAWQRFSLNSILIMMIAGVITNLGTISLIAFVGNQIYLPLTVIIVFVNLLITAGTIDGIGDFEAVLSDYDEDEKKTNLAQRFLKTPTIFFKILLAIIFGGSALTQLYIMYLVKI